MKCLPNYKNRYKIIKRDGKLRKKEKTETESAMKSKNKNVKCVEAKRKMFLSEEHFIHAKWPSNNFNILLYFGRGKSQD